MITGKIIGTGSYAPKNVITNDDLTRVVETNDEWIYSRTGIKERRITSEETTTDISVIATELALKNAGIQAEEIDVIIVGTSTQDNCFPSVACEVQGRIGAKNAVGFDVSAACSGFTYALNILQAFIQAGVYRTGVIIGVDILSKIVDWNDRGTCVLFGDGAGAVVVKASETGILSMMMGADGTKGDVLSVPSRSNGNFLLGKEPEIGYVHMDGQEVFKFAVKIVPECVKDVLEKAETSIDEIKYFILHQANSRIFEGVAKRLKQPIEKFPMNLQTYGNTSAASVPLMLDELNQEGKLNRGDKIILVGFGGGLTWGATLIEW